MTWNFQCPFNFLNSCFNFFQPSCSFFVLSKFLRSAGSAKPLSLCATALHKVWKFIILIIIQWDDIRIGRLVKTPIINIVWCDDVICYAEQIELYLVLFSATWQELCEELIQGLLNFKIIWNILLNIIDDSFTSTILKPDGCAELHSEILSWS